VGFDNGWGGLVGGWASLNILFNIMNMPKL